MQLFAYKLEMFEKTVSMITIALWVHIAGGTLALAAFLLPLFSKKGGKLHTRAGWVYTVAMVLVVLGAFVITPWRYFADPQRSESSQNFALFLFFIALFALTNLQQGLVVFRFKIRENKIKNVKTLGLPVILILVSMSMLIYALLVKNILFGVFSIFALSSGYKQVRYWLTDQAQSKDWWFFHLDNMFICCIATVTAFTVTAVPRVFPAVGPNQLLLWLFPTAIMVPWMIWFKKRYEKKFKLAS